ncbi:hypothetical protein ACED51_04505 [Photobacterium swingsii]|uniref:hypothetical protein n=1 Tax=Photobacterium swingsii TaxID=680026 RepID=UPI00352D2D38
MSTIETWISVVGSIASICGAIWAFIEAGKASNAATKAENVKDEIIERRKLVEVSQVYAETSRILKVVSKVGPSCNQSLLRGVNCGTIAKDAEEYSRFINEHSSHFTDFFENKARELCEQLHPFIEGLSEAKTFEDKKAAGKSIYYKINAFMPFVKQLSDDKKENVATK